MNIDRNKEVIEFLLNLGLRPNAEGLYDGVELADFKDWSDKENAQLLQQNKELREALESAKRGCDSLKLLIDVLEARNQELYDAISHISRQNNYGYIKDYATKTLSKHPNK